MSAGPWPISPQMLAAVRRLKARPTLRAQRAAYRARMVSKAEQRMRELAPLKRRVAIGANAAPQPPGDKSGARSETTPDSEG